MPSGQRKSPDASNGNAREEESAVGTSSLKQAQKQISVLNGGSMLHTGQGIPNWPRALSIAMLHQPSFAIIGVSNPQQNHPQNSDRAQLPNPSENGNFVQSEQNKGPAANHFTPSLFPPAPVRIHNINDARGNTYAVPISHRLYANPSFPGVALNAALNVDTNMRVSSLAPKTIAAPQPQQISTPNSQPPNRLQNITTTQRDTKAVASSKSPIPSKQVATDRNPKGFAPSVAQFPGPNITGSRTAIPPQVNMAAVLQGVKSADCAILKSRNAATSGVPVTSKYVAPAPQLFSGSDDKPGSSSLGSVRGVTTAGTRNWPETKASSEAMRTATASYANRLDILAPTNPVLSGSHGIKEGMQRYFDLTRSNNDIVLPMAQKEHGLPAHEVDIARCKHGIPTHKITPSMGTSTSEMAQFRSPAIANPPPRNTVSKETSKTCLTSTSLKGTKPPKITTRKPAPEKSTKAGEKNHRISAIDKVGNAVARAPISRENGALIEESTNRQKHTDQAISSGDATIQSNRIKQKCLSDEVTEKTRMKDVMPRGRLNLGRPAKDPVSSNSSTGVARSLQCTQKTGEQPTHMDSNECSNAGKNNLLLAASPLQDAARSMLPSTKVASSKQQTANNKQEDLGRTKNVSLPTTSNTTKTVAGQSKASVTDSSVFPNISPSQSVNLSQPDALGSSLGIQRQLQSQPAKTSAPKITPEQIKNGIPENASAIFHILDRRINFDNFPPDASFYSLLRAWVQDDPCRQIPPQGINLLDYAPHPSGRCEIRTVDLRKGRKRKLEPSDVFFKLAQAEKAEITIESLRCQIIRNAKRIRRGKRKEQAKRDAHAMKRLNSLGIFLPAASQNF